MKTNKKKKIIGNEEEDDYIIDNDQEIIDYQSNNNKKNNYAINRNNKSPKGSNQNKTGNWIKEAKAKYQRQKNLNNDNINKTDSVIYDNNNNRKQKKIVNFDDIPVGGNMGGVGDFSVEIRVPPKKNNYMQNNSYVENNNIQYRNETNIRKNLDNKTNFIKPKKANNNYLEENDNNNQEPAEMERKNSMVSIITQTCDKEMLGRSEFIGIPINQNSNEINFSNNLDNLSNNKQSYSIYEKHDNNIGVSSFSNKISDFGNTQNLREKTENAIQLQNVQRELDNEIEMNKRLQGQIENYKSEFNNLREELVKKSDIINELQQKDIVNNYEEMKKNFDKAIERIKYLSEENDELKETIMKYEANNKKLKKEIRHNKEKIISTREKKSKNKKYMEKNDIKSENNDEEEVEQNKSENENIYEEQEINPKKEKESVEEKDERIIENKQEKISIIPEDNDIFCTKNYDNKIQKKPRKIQEDGIPVIKRVEEKDNVKDIMVNTYAANDDIYYNRPPVGKPKVKRMKKNNDLDNNLYNYQEENTNKKNVEEFNKNKLEYNSFENNEEEVKNNDKNEVMKSKDNFERNIINRRKNNLNNITTNVGVFPSQIKVIANEREILNLESQLFNLQKERDLVNDEYLKYPEYPKKREEINAKRKIEMKLEEMNKEISLQKLKIRELKGKK